MNNNQLQNYLPSHQIENILKTSGIHPTAQRIAICRYVLCDAKHITVDEIKEWAELNYPKISLATIYNTINILVEAALVRALKLPHSDRVIYDNNMETHYHFLDEKSGELIDIPSGNLEFKTDLGKEFKINQVEILIRGTRD
jgi:Fur family iron response transcriptional regulator